MGMTTGKVTPPPARVPVAVLDVPAVRGEALVLWTVVDGRDTHLYGFRGWAEVYEVAAGPVIEVVPDADWHRFVLLGTIPEKVTQWPARGAWIV